MKKNEENYPKSGPNIKCSANRGLLHFRLHYFHHKSSYPICYIISDIPYNGLMQCSAQSLFCMKTANYYNQQIQMIFTDSTVK